MATTILDQKTEALYQKDGTLHTYTTTISSLSPLSSLPEDRRALFKAPEGEPYIVTTPSTIFHAQGGGQPSDTGTIMLSSSNTPSTTSPSVENSGKPTFHVHQVRKVDAAILHMGLFNPPDARFAASSPILQAIDTEKRLLHSRIHTAGHVIGVAINILTKSTPSVLPADIIDGKASHYPGAAFVEFSGLIPGTAKQAIQDKVDELVSQDLPVGIHFWTEAEAEERCIGTLGDVKGDENGVRVVEIGNEGKGVCGSYPCGGTHVLSLKELGRVVIRNIKRQKGISKVSYEVGDA